MAHFGFRSSMFGFKKEDVILYLERSAKEHSVKVQNLEEKLSALQNENQELLNQKNALEEDLARTTQKLDYYSGKEAEIEKTSVSIGTMYLVAKQNAAEVIKSAEAYAKEVAEHSKKQLSAASEVDKKLNSLKAELSDTADRFSGSVTNMAASLDEIKSRLENELSKIENKNKDIELVAGDI